MRRVAALRALIQALFRPLGVAACCAVLTVACSGGGDPAATPTPSPDQAVARALSALRASRGYRVTMQSHNFVLPRWGGVDAADLRVATDGSAAAGRLDRTGDGTYTVLFAGGQTFFRRSTCDHLARVPGGGPDVLASFFFATNGAFERASNLLYAHPARDGVIAITGRFGDLGPALLVLDAGTYAPRRLAVSRDPASGAEAVIRFADWDSAPDVSSPAGQMPDQGPGGNPC